MATKKFTIGRYQVRTEPRTPENLVEVFVEDRAFTVLHDPDSGRYTTTMMPYRDFDDLQELVKAVVQKHPDFRK